MNFNVRILGASLAFTITASMAACSDDPASTDESNDVSTDSATNQKDGSNSTEEDASSVEKDANASDVLIGDSGGDSGSAAFGQPCTTPNEQSNCAAGLTCRNYPNKSMNLCTKTCDGNGDCPAPSNKCGGSKLCAFP